MSMVRKSSISFPIGWLDGASIVGALDLDAGPVVILVVGLSLIRLIRYQENDERKQESRMSNLTISRLAS
jgi:hypothetical protein